MGTSSQGKKQLGKSSLTQLEKGRTKVFKIRLRNVDVKSREILVPIKHGLKGIKGILMSKKIRLSIYAFIQTVSTQASDTDYTEQKT